MELENPEEKELRMVLVGKTGVGKSAAGNTILQRKPFKSTSAASSVTSECQKETCVFHGQTLAVVDTPGLFDTFKNEAEIVTEIAKCILFAAPGPHVFLLVVQAGRFTEEEQKAVKLIQELFGEKAANYTLVLFTRGDDLVADGIKIEEFIKKNKLLSDFIDQCQGRYHVFNNRTSDPSQVETLVGKITTMVNKNGGRYYTNDVFKEAYEEIVKETKEILRKNLSITHSEARAMVEKDHRLLQRLLQTTTVANGVASGACIGALIGSVGGPIGVGVGALVGTLVGAVGVVLKTKTCKIQ